MYKKYFYLFFLVIFAASAAAASETGFAPEQGVNGSEAPSAVPKEPEPSDGIKRLAPLSPREKFDHQPAIQFSYDPQPPLSKEPSFEELFQNLKINPEQKKELQIFIDQLKDQIKTFAESGGERERLEAGMGGIEKFSAPEAEAGNLVETISAAMSEAFAEIKRQEPLDENRPLSVLNRFALDAGHSYRFGLSQPDLPQAAAAEKKANEGGDTPVWKSVLDILRDRAITSEKAELRAIYKNWYLALSKKVRRMELALMRSQAGSRA